MSNLDGKKFAASYSGGKDSVLAIYRAVGAGLVPLELITTYGTDATHSWFHGLPETLLQKVSMAMSIPVKLVKTTGEEYEELFEKALIEGKQTALKYAYLGILISRSIWNGVRCAVKKWDLCRIFHCGMKAGKSWSTSL